MPRFTETDLRAACDLVYTQMPPTPQYAWPLLAEATGAEVWMKHENHTPTGAFKVRGGLTYLEQLADEGLPAGLVTATRGNHGQSIPFAAARYGVPVTVVVPEGNSSDKNRAMRVLFTDTHNIAEGAGAAALAGLAREQEAQRGKRVAVILCGGNVDAAVFAAMLQGAAGGPGSPA
jgi:threonine dehydratase